MEIEETLYIEYDEAVWLHFRLMWEWEEIRFGIDRRDLLESALARPKHVAVYENADVVSSRDALLRFDKKSPVARRKQANGNLFDENILKTKWLYTQIRNSRNA